MFFRTFGALALALTLAGCAGKSAADYQKEAQTALDGGEQDKALQLADEGLKVAGDDKAVAWRLEQVRLDAIAKGAGGGALVADLERLRAAYPAQVTPALYRSIADKLVAGDNKSGAIDVLAAGDKTFPGDATFVTAINELNASGVSAEEVEKLKALGYL